MEETLTVHRLGERLRRSLATTNPSESCPSTVERVAGKRQTLAQRRSAAALDRHRLPEAERKFRRVQGFRELENLHHKLNPSLTQYVIVSAQLPERFA